MQLNYEETTKAGTSPNVTRVYIRWLIQRHVERCRSIATDINRRFGVDDPQNPREESLTDYPRPLFFSFFFPGEEWQTLEATTFPQDAISQRHRWAEVVDHL